MMSAQPESATNAVLPTLSDYLTAIAPVQHRQALWRWAAGVPAARRRGARVVDLTFDPGPQRFVGEEWVPVAGHPRWAIWIVRRR